MQMQLGEKKQRREKVARVVGRSRPTKLRQRENKRTVGKMVTKKTQKKRVLRRAVAAAAAVAAAKHDEKVERRRRFNKMLLRQPLAVAPSALLRGTKTTRSGEARGGLPKKNIVKNEADEQRVGTAELLARSPATMPPAGPSILNLGNP